MAKSKQQKREEALVRQLESFKRDQKRFIEQANTSDKYYDSHDHKLAWVKVVNSAYASRVDIHGNYLVEEYYKKPWQFGKDADPKDLAENFTAYTLEELKKHKAQDGQTLFKKAYGTEPLTDKSASPYDINDAASIDAFLKAGGMTGVLTEMTRQDLKHGQEKVATPTRIPPSQWEEMLASREVVKQMQATGKIPTREE